MFWLDTQTRDRPIFDLLNIGRYANSNFTIIREVRYWPPIFYFKYRYRFKKSDIGRYLGFKKVISVGFLGFKK